ncbi:MAG TPA: nickel insertion protein, partial [Verrucomicrobiae bacterium]|nr:nickel insertion protein [Verrucomicrobiae bacterium]
MKTLYLDIFSGISGDMFIGALIDLGADASRLEHELKKLGLGGYHLHIARQRKAAIEGVKFDVHVGHEHKEHHPIEDKHSHEHARAGATAHAHSHSHHHAGDHDHDHPHDDHHSDHAHGHDHDHDHDDHHDHVHTHGRTFTEIRKLILASDLSAWVKDKAVKVFERVAIAEGRIHGLPPEEVHFHEVGAV